MYEGKNISERYQRMGFKRIDVRDIDGFKLGNAENQSAGTGCTVIIPATAPFSDIMTVHPVPAL